MIDTFKTLTTHHQPVMLAEVKSLLEPKSQQSYLDLTAGYGGHAAEVIAATKAPQKAVLVDRDKSAADFLKSKFQSQGVKIWQSDFYEASQKLAEAGKRFDLILADLGVSSPHLDNASRGFSLKQAGPLDMRMDQSADLTADEIVNRWDQSRLAGILKSYGEEPKADKMAAVIVKARPISNTAELADAVAKATGRRGKVHPATRVFMAIRLAVNDELAQLEKALPVWISLLNPGGRLAVISFHSLEDRLVKEAFKSYAAGRYSATLKLLSKKPIAPTRNEIVINPRARSAKLRAAVKIKTKEGE